jgi:energy-coupling factor transporter ATP-binding protein EcfA2
VDWDITLSDYRCFSAERPAVIELRSNRQAFVGLNNSGKSALLRMFFELRPLWQSLASTQNWKGLRRGLDLQLLSPAAQQLPTESVIRSNSRSKRTAICFQSKDNTTTSPTSFSIEIADRSVRLVVPDMAELPAEATLIETDTRGELSYATNRGTMHFGNVSTVLDFAAELSMVQYMPAARSSATGSRGGQAWFDTKIGSELVAHLRQIETNRSSEVASKFNIVQSTIGEILGLEGLRIIPIPDGDRNDLQISVKGRTRNLDEYGTGVGEFVIVAMQAFVMNPSWLLIDEPESHLHPAMQIRFLELLASQAKYGILFATHSLGLARMAADKVWVVTKDRDTDVSTVSPLADPKTPSELLLGLQYGSFAAIGASHILWVEGPTDAAVFRQWLPKLDLDLKFLVLPLRGTDGIRVECATELSEIKRLGIPVSAIIDSERDSEAAELQKGRMAFVSECEKAQIGVLVTKLRAIENYFDQASIDEAFPDHGYKALAQFEKGPNGWPKRDNWKIARAMTEEAIRATDIGQFIIKIANDQEKVSESPQASP